eukprot:512859-Rhodomonas_salina.1
MLKRCGLTILSNRKLVVKHCKSTKIAFATVPQPLLVPRVPGDLSLLPLSPKSKFEGHRNGIAA